MCGIAGFWNPEGLDDRADSALRSMVESLHHRGPDGRGYHVDRARGLGLGHARLSIIDLETGDQPLRSSDDRLWLVVNGEFYDYKRIRSELMTRGDRFTTRSDSEIALHLYRRHGLDFLHHLRGEFAFALFDATRETLYLVRDRFGIRPLFWRHDGGTLQFGSEAKAILAHPDVRPRLSAR